MGVEKYKVVLSNNAKSELKSIEQYISNRSSKAMGRKVRLALIELVRSLKHNPRRFTKEEYLKRSEEEFRSVTKWNYKIIYEIRGDTVLVAKFFHTSQDPGKMQEVSKD